MWKNTDYDFQWFMVIIGLISLIIGYSVNNPFIESFFVAFGWGNIILNPLIIIFMIRQKKYNSK